MFGSTNQSFEKLPGDDFSVNSSDEGSSFLTQYEQSPKSSRIRTLRSWMWVISTCIFALLSIILAIGHWNPQKWSLGTFETGFKTDFGPIKSQIGIVKYQFTGGLHLDEHGTLQREVDPTQPQFVGEPSEAIDESWDDLLSVMEIIVKGSEADEVRGRTTQGQNEGEWRMSLDAYHSFHCLNSVRKAVDPQYYNPDGKHTYFYRRHLDHCIDYLRQVIQCQSDLTPLTYYHEPRYNTSIPIFGQPHTCRDFSKINQWAREREGHMRGS
ncbi:hypothetical protein N431DRAFT_472280 [Stipitochalara longipes BDJ]|nr:hypothetical protein N431DRAFT_472280 [Stipitochalara longipes BDJ]